MYACNGSRRFHVGNVKNPKFYDVLTSSLDRGEPLVEIGAYALLPNHPHFVLKQVFENGVSLFMQKVFTGYTMYFNKKNERTGALFAGTYKSKHVADDRYLKRLVPYIHCNPVELYEPKWKEGKGNLTKIEKWLRRYRYSSLPDFLGKSRPEKALLGESIFELFSSIQSVRETLAESQAYYAETYRG